MSPTLARIPGSNIRTTSAPRPSTSCNKECAPTHSDHDLAAGDVQRGAGDPRGHVRGEEQGRGGDVAWLTDPAQRERFSELAAHLLCRPGAQAVSFNRGGRDAVHTDAIWRDLVGE